MWYIIKRKKYGMVKVEIVNHKELKSGDYICHGPFRSYNEALDFLEEDE